MMNMFALGLEEAFAPREHLLLAQGIARLGYADDLHLFGKVSALSQRWELVVQTLADAGLQVQPTQSFGLRLLTYAKQPVDKCIPRFTSLLP